jgi:ATP-dependent helicase/nuclease subunit A
MGKVPGRQKARRRKDRRVSISLQHTSIRASAGAGKTYQLANRYLALLLLQGLSGGKIAPEKIVAVTFTRKGAGEFAERILHRLARAAGDASERDKLQADLDRLIQGDTEHGVAGLAPGVELVVDAATLQRALAQVIDGFDRLALGTIDSFMARSVQTLAFELGLGGFEIMEDAAIQREREALLSEVLRTVDAASLQSFYQTIKLATLRSCSRLQDQLERFVIGYHRLLHSLPSAHAWGGEVFWDGAAPASSGTEYRAGATALGAQVAAHDFGDGRVNKALAGALDWLAGRNPGSRGSPAGWLNSGDKLAELWLNWPDREWAFDYYRKQRTIPSTMMKSLKPVLAAWVAAESTALSRKTSAIQDIVSRYEALYDRLARRKGRLTFEDLPLLLSEKSGVGISNGALSLLAFRWYQQFDHWLLDEFQDTSRAQWEVLKPWLDEAIQDAGGTKSVFVVGDPKQSIYGWRGGEPRLFDELTASYPGAFQEQVMAESWRSRPAVLELVNRVCDPASNPALRDPEQFSPGALARWHYDHHVATKERQTEGGYAAVLLAPQAEEGDSAVDTEPELGGCLADKLSAQAKVIKAVLETVHPLERGLSCAILVRKNDNAQAIAQWLRAHGVTQVMVEGVATLAAQSPVVAALVDALRWMAAPANALAAGHISLTPLWNVLEQPLRNAQVTEVPPGAVWRHWRGRVAESGAPQITHEWSAALSASHSDPYTQYCLRHVSQAAQQAGAELGLPDWLATLEQLTVRETAASGSIHVMTIHKAKGLGFDVVFLPDLDSGTGRHEEILIRRDGQGCAVGCLAYPPKWLQAWEQRLQILCNTQEAEQELETLCVLYVALTRAKEATFVILNKDAPRQASAARNWILSALSAPGDATGKTPAAPPWGDGESYWESGSRGFCAGRKVAITPAGAQQEVVLSAPVPRRTRRRPSDAGHLVLGGTGASAHSQSGQDFGTAVHAVFAQIEWWRPGQHLEGQPDPVALVQKCLGVQAIRSLFTRESGQDEALRELPVEFVEGQTWWSGIIDRLVLRRDEGGGVRRAILVDFKTDHAESAATLRERYSEQLNVYRRAVSIALRLGDDQIEVVLLSTCLAELVRL